MHTSNKGYVSRTYNHRLTKTDKTINIWAIDCNRHVTNEDT